jgi:hypothetical protein
MSRPRFLLRTINQETFRLADGRLEFSLRHGCPLVFAQGPPSGVVLADCANMRKM